MGVIQRAPGEAESRRHDLVVVGGGIYGAMIALEATRRGQAPLLLEAGDFGGATSHNNLRIVHGGLRYLQTADLPRFHESVAERRWFLEHLPDLVSPLACLMPLDGRGPRRGWLMGPALLANDVLSLRRNRGVDPARRLPAGRLVSRDRVRALFPGVRPERLRGGAVWHDAFAPDMHRLVMELLRWATRHGATCLNYVRVDGLRTEGRAGGAGGRVVGVEATDEVEGRKLCFETDRVVNAAGPWSRLFSRQAGDERPELFEGALAWNVLYDRPALSPASVAVAPPRPGGQVLFAVPWHGRLLVGTGHAPFVGEPASPVPDAEQLQRFTRDVNEAVPGLDLGPHEIARVFSGLLPTTRAGSAELTHREVTIDHGRTGGPAGLHSVSGIKFTTARRVADKVLSAMAPEARPAPWSSFDRPAPRGAGETGVDRPWGWRPEPGDTQWLEALRPIAREESVVHLDDLMLRRSAFGDEPARARALAEPMAALFDWSEARRQHEVGRVREQIERGLPTASRAPATAEAGMPSEVGAEVDTARKGEPKS